MNVTTECYTSECYDNSYTPGRDKREKNIINGNHEKNVKRKWIATKYEPDDLRAKETE